MHKSRLTRVAAAHESNGSRKNKKPKHLTRNEQRKADYKKKAGT